MPMGVFAAGCAVSARSVGKKPGHMSHLAARPDLGLAVEVHGRSRNAKPAAIILDLAADQVGHLAPAMADRLAERPAGHRPDMLLELRHRGAVQRPMAGIVPPG